MKKFDFKKALTNTGGALAGGVAAGFVEKELGSKVFPNDPGKAAYVPLALGAFLSTQKNPMLAAAGMGMVGAMGTTIAENLDLGITGVQRLNAGGDYTRLSPAQQNELRELQIRRKQANAMNGDKSPSMDSYNKAFAAN